VTPVAEQHMAALASANRIRLERAQIKRGLAAWPSRHDAFGALAELIDGGEVESVPVDELLQACRDSGRLTMLRVLRAAGIGSELKRIRELTERQRKSLAYVLRDNTTPRGAPHG